MINFDENHQQLLNALLDDPVGKTVQFTLTIDVVSEETLIVEGIVVSYRKTAWDQPLAFGIEISEGTTIIIPWHSIFSVSSIS